MLLRSQRALAASIILVVLFTSHSLSAAELAPDTCKAIDSAVKAFIAKHHVPGLSAAIVSEKQLSYERGYGLADVENNVPATSETVYRLASISKMLTGVAVMQLVEQGKIDLAAPIQKYAPSFPEKQAPITCELLLKHQSGIRHYKGDEVHSAVSYRRVADSFKIFQDDPLLFTPGEKFSYTTYGFNLLGAAIEGASGQDYVTYVQEHVCKPAGMATIQPDRPEKIVPHRAAGYRRVGTAAVSVLMNDFAVDVSNKIPGGGWCSTPGDLARFAIALADAKLVSRETLDKMWTRQATADGKLTDVGLSCFVGEYEGQRRISHSGGQPKVSTFLILAPDQGMAVALMCNVSNSPVQALAGDILNIVSNQDAVKSRDRSLPTHHRPVPVDHGFEITEIVPVGRPVEIDFGHGDRAPVLGLGKDTPFAVVDARDRPVHAHVAIRAAGQKDVVLAGSRAGQQGIAAGDRPGDHFRATIRKLAGHLGKESVVTDHHADLAEPRVEHRILVTRRHAHFDLAARQRDLSVFANQFAVRTD